MKNRTVIYLVLTIVTGLLGFVGLDFEGVVGVRVLFLIFADLFVISILSKVLFKEEKQLRPIKVKR